VSRKKIILVGPRVVNGHLDNIVLNFQLPLQSLGYEVVLLDTTRAANNERLHDLVTAIKQYTDEGKIKTFNWFCDDSYRFESFSSQMCHNFHMCSTPEPSRVQDYIDLGYETIVHANWHANEDLYSDFRYPENNIKFGVSFIGSVNGYPSREKYLRYLIDNGVEVVVPQNVPHEQMVQLMAHSLISLSFSRNPNALGHPTQMKGRMFEIPACGSMLLSEYHEGIEDCFKENKEAVYFRNEQELLVKLKSLLDSPEKALKIARNGYERYKADHSSQKRLATLMDKIWSLKITT